MSRTIHIHSLSYLGINHLPIGNMLMSVQKNVVAHVPTLCRSWFDSDSIFSSVLRYFVVVLIFLLHVHSLVWGNTHTYGQTHICAHCVFSIYFRFPFSWLTVKYNGTRICLPQWVLQETTSVWVRLILPFFFFCNSLKMRQHLKWMKTNSKYDH